MVRRAMYGGLMYAILCFSRRLPTSRERTDDAWHVFEGSHHTMSSYYVDVYFHVHVYFHVQDVFQCILKQKL